MAVADQLVPLPNLTVLWSLSLIRAAPPTPTWLSCLSKLFLFLLHVRAESTFLDLLQRLFALLVLKSLLLLVLPGLCSLIHALIETFWVPHFKARWFLVRDDALDITWWVRCCSLCLNLVTWFRRDTWIPGLPLPHEFFEFPITCAARTSLNLNLCNRFALHLWCRWWVTLSL